MQSARQAYSRQFLDRDEFRRSSTRDHCSYALPMGAFTMTDCRAAFISTGAGSIVCAELSGGESSILLSRKNPALSVGEVKERHVKHEHRVVNFWSTPKNLARGGMATKCLGLSTSVNCPCALKRKVLRALHFCESRESDRSGGKVVAARNRNHHSLGSIDSVTR